MDTIAPPLSNKFAGDPLMGCSAHKPKFCNLSGLTIADNTGGHTVDCCLPATATVARSSAMKKLAIIWKPMVDAHGAVIDILADFKFKEEAPEKTSLSITAKSSDQCNGPQHPIITFAPSPLRTCSAPAISRATDHVTVMLVGEPEAGATSTGVPEAHQCCIWPFSRQPLIYIIKAASCGNPSDPDGQQISELEAMVRVFRKEDYSLEFAIPAYHGFKKELAATWDTAGKVTTTNTSTHKRFGEVEKLIAHSETRSAGSPMPTNISDTKQTRIADFSIKTKVQTGIDSEGNAYNKVGQDVDESKTTVISVKGSDVPLFTTKTTVKTLHTSRPDGSDPQCTAVVSKLYEVKPTLSLKRNSLELPITEIINSFLNIYTKITEAWNEIKEFVPQVGFKGSLDLAIMQGTASGTWGYRYPDSQQSPNYSIVQRYLTFKLEAKIFEVTASASFGVELKIPSVREKLFSIKGTNPWLQVIAKISGTLILNASANCSLTLSEGKSKVNPVKIESKNSAKLTAEYLVSAAGFILEHAKVEVTAGLNFEGEVKAEFSEGIYVEGKLKRTSVMLTVYFKSDLEQSPDLDGESETLELWEEKVIKDPVRFALWGGVSKY